MDDPTRLPFLDKRGRLYIAPLTADLPLQFATGGVFGDEPKWYGDTRSEERYGGWPQAWILGGETDPEQCSARTEVDTEQIRVGEALESLRLAQEETVWTFGLDHVNMRPTPWTSLPPLPEGQVPWAPRFMVGWESEDRTSRVIARQVVQDLGTMLRPSESSALFCTYRLEQAQKPLPPLPVWRRLLDRLLRRRPPVRVPDLYPMFEVYQVAVAS